MPGLIYVVFTCSVYTHTHSLGGNYVFDTFLSVLLFLLFFTFFHPVIGRDIQLRPGTPIEAACTSWFTKNFQCNFINVRKQELGVRACVPDGSHDTSADKAWKQPPPQARSSRSRSGSPLPLPGPRWSRDSLVVWSIEPVSQTCPQPCEWQPAKDTGSEALLCSHHYHDGFWVGGWVSEWYINQCSANKHVLDERADSHATAEQDAEEHTVCLAFPWQSVIIYLFFKKQGTSN